MKCRRMCVFVAIAALLLALLLPAAASAGASVSDEAASQWETQWEKELEHQWKTYGSDRFMPYEKDADGAMLDAFSGDEFDGAVVESYAIDASRHPNRGAAILRLADGALHAYALAMDEPDMWRIAERTGDLSCAKGVDSARVSYWNRITVSLFEDGEPIGVLEFAGEPGEMALICFSSENANLMTTYVKELEELRFDNVRWNGDFNDPDDPGKAYVAAGAEAVYSHTVYESESIARVDEFDLSFREFDLDRLLDALSKKTEDGVSYVDGDMTVGALAAREESGIPADIPVLPEPLGFAYALPMPVLAHFAPGLRFDVYTGPGRRYAREENGNASLSTDDWVFVFGEENGWLMVLYRAGERELRFGYIEATQEQAGVSVPQLTWIGEPVEIFGAVTNDPFYRSSVVVEEVEWLHPYDGKLIGAFGSDWACVETTTENGVPARGFVLIDDFHYAWLWERMGCICLSDGESTALYDAPGGEEIGRLYPGAWVTVKEERSGMLRVAYYAKESFDVGAQGWIDPEDFVPADDVPWEYIEVRDLETMRVVWLADGEDGEAHAYVLVAEAGDTAYLEEILDSRGIQTPRSSLRSTTRAWLIKPEGDEDDEDDDEELDCLSDDAEMKNGIWVMSSDNFSSGMAVDVLTHVDGMALVVMHGYYWNFSEFGWVDERYLTDCAPTTYPGLEETDDE